MCFHVYTLATRAEVAQKVRGNNVRQAQYTRSQFFSIAWFMVLICVCVCVPSVVCPPNGAHNYPFEFIDVTILC